MNAQSLNGEISNPDVAQESWREYQILHRIDHDDVVSQRSLSESVGIALGLTNQIVKRLIRKGLVKTSRADARRIAYSLTPQGFAEKLRLVMNYTRCTISFFATVRRIAREHLQRLMSESKVRRIAILGTGEVAEAVYLSVQELGLEFTAVVEEQGPANWFGKPVWSLSQEHENIADAVIVTGLGGLDGSRGKVERLAPIVVEMRELLNDGLANFAKRFVEETADRVITRSEL